MRRVGDVASVNGPKRKGMAKGESKGDDAKSRWSDRGRALMFRGSELQLRQGGSGEDGQEQTAHDVYGARRIKHRSYVSQNNERRRYVITIRRRRGTQSLQDTDLTRG